MKIPALFAAVNTVKIVTGVPGALVASGKPAFTPDHAITPAAISKKLFDTLSRRLYTRTIPTQIDRLPLSATSAEADFCPCGVAALVHQFAP